MNSCKPRFYLDWKALQQRQYFDDFGFLAQIEDASLVFTGGDTFQLVPNPITGDIVQWGPLKFVSSVTGKVVAVAAGSSAISDGDVLYVAGVKHPIENQGLALQIGRAGSREVKRFGNLFVGCRVGEALMLRPAGKTSGDVLKLDGDAYLPISEAEDGSAAPGAITNYVDGDARIRVRLFVRVTADSAHFTWEAPDDLDTAEPLQARWYGVVTGTEIAVLETAQFDFSGFASGDAVDLDGTFGAAARSSSLGYHGVGSRVMGTKVDVDVADLGAGKLVQLKLQRYSGDSYAGSVYIYGVKLFYKREQT